jgi:hypothetical protein
VNWIKAAPGRARRAGAAQSGSGRGRPEGRRRGVGEAGRESLISKASELQSFVWKPRPGWKILALTLKRMQQPDSAIKNAIPVVQSALAHQLEPLLREQIRYSPAATWISHWWKFWSSPFSARPPQAPTTITKPVPRRLDCSHGA